MVIFYSYVTVVYQRGNKAIWGMILTRIPLISAYSAGPPMPGRNGISTTWTLRGFLPAVMQGIGRAAMLQYPQVSDFGLLSTHDHPCIHVHVHLDRP
jgi:hypothetical protein